MAPLGIPHHHPPPEVDKKETSVFKISYLDFRNKITLLPPVRRRHGLFLSVCSRHSRPITSACRNSSSRPFAAGWSRARRGWVARFSQCRAAQASLETGIQDLGGSFHRPSVLLSVVGKLVFVPHRWNKELKITLLNIGIG